MANEKLSIPLYGQGNVLRLILKTEQTLTLKTGRDMQTLGSFLWFLDLWISLENSRRWRPRLFHRSPWVIFHTKTQTASVHFLCNEKRKPFNFCFTATLCPISTNHSKTRNRITNTIPLLVFNFLLCQWSFVVQQSVIVNTQKWQGCKKQWQQHSYEMNVTFTKRQPQSIYWIWTQDINNFAPTIVLHMNK